MDLVRSVATSFSRFGLDASSEKLYYSLEDSADRWNFSYTFVLLFLMCSVSTANVYFLRSFECTTNQDAPGGSNVQGFIQASCWTQGTIALTGNDTTPNSNEEWEYLGSRGKISFYQWVPFVLGLQAIMFLIPHLIWDFMASHTFGEDTNLLLERSMKASKADDPDERTKIVKVVASQITRICVHTADNRKTKWANAQRWLSKKIPGGKLFTVGKRLGNRIAAFYLITKILYLINLIGQLFLIKGFLTYGRTNSLWFESSNLIRFAFDLAKSMTELSNWEGGGSALFPRRAYCIVPLRGFGSRENVYIASCSLPVNMYNEKLYVFLWFWLSLVLCITIISFISWLFRMLCYSSSDKFLRTMLETVHHADGTPMAHELTRSNLKDFVNSIIRSDGILMLRMIKINSGAIITSEICLSAWNQYHELVKNSYVTYRELDANCPTLSKEEATDLATMYHNYPSCFEFLNEKNNNTSAPIEMDGLEMGGSKLNNGFNKNENLI